MTTTTSAPRPPLPPEEHFWRRYSPNHELLLSGVGSFGLHLAVVILVTLAAALGLSTWLQSGEKEPLPLGAIGVPGLGDGAAPAEQHGDADAPRTEAAVPEQTPFKGPDLRSLPRPRANPAEFANQLRDAETRRYIEADNLAVIALEQMHRDVRNQLLDGLKRGDGTRKGARDGVGVLDGSRRVERVLRWTLLFDTRDGADYVRQLDALGAIIGVPDADGRYQIIRNLKQRPARGQQEDVARINRIFWVDDRPESVQALAEGLGLKPVPTHLVAFFPEALEKRLVDLEQKFQKLHEDEILETRFRVVRKGGTFGPVVLDQRRK